MWIHSFNTNWHYSPPQSKYIWKSMYNHFVINFTSPLSCMSMVDRYFLVSWPFSILPFLPLMCHWLSLRIKLLIHVEFLIHTEFLIHVDSLIHFNLTLLSSPIYIDLKIYVYPLCSQIHMQLYISTHLHIYRHSPPFYVLFLFLHCLHAIIDISVQSQILLFWFAMYFIFPLSCMSMVDCFFCWWVSNFDVSISLSCVPLIISPCVIAYPYVVANPYGFAHSKQPKITLLHNLHIFDNLYVPTWFSNPYEIVHLYTFACPQSK